MPHKRAKRSVREQQRSDLGTDLAPTTTTSSEGIPKSLIRVLSAATIRKQWKEKRKLAEADVVTEGTKRKRRRKAYEVDSAEQDVALQIQPGEALGHFNRRVDDNMRPLINSAMKSSSVMARGQESNSKAQAVGLSTSRKRAGKMPITAQGEGGDADKMSKSQDHAYEQPKEFKTISTSTPKMLNNIAQAPPELKKFTRKSHTTAATVNGVLSMAQRTMVEEERERVIARYRALKEASRKKAGAGVGNPIGQESR